MAGKLFCLLILVTQICIIFFKILIYNHKHLGDYLEIYFFQLKLVAYPLVQLRNNTEPCQKLFMSFLSRRNHTSCTPFTTDWMQWPAQLQSVIKCSVISAFCLLYCTNTAEASLLSCIQLSSRNPNEEYDTVSHHFPFSSFFFSSTLSVKQFTITLPSVVFMSHQRFLFPSPTLNIHFVFFQQ